MNTIEKIKHKLSIELEPTRLDVIDLSEEHRGHGGWRDGQTTHVEVLIVSEKFCNISKINRHKIIHKLLEKELKNGIHALSIKAFSTKEKL